MRSYYLVFLSAFFFFVSFAATPTPPSTPTPGGDPIGDILMSTPTPVSLACPTGTPIGWGTVTPSAGWLGFCAPCVPNVTPTVYPTLNLTPKPGEGTEIPTAIGGGQIPSNTPVSTFTPIPSSTPVPTSPAVVFCNTAQPSGGVCVNSSNQKSVSITVSDTYGFCRRFASVLSNCPSCSAGYDIHVAYSLNGILTPFTVTKWHSFTYGVPGNTYNVLNTGQVHSNSISVSGQEVITMPGLVSVLNPVDIFGQYCNSTGGSYSGTVLVWVGDDPRVTPTPTITPSASPTPAPGSYCGSVSSGDNSLGAFETGFSDPVLFRCITTPRIDFADIADDISGFLGFGIVLFLSDLLGGLPVIDAFGICFYAYSFTIKVFGVILPTDWIIRAALLVGIWNAAGGALGQGSSLLGQFQNHERNPINKGRFSDVIGSTDYKRGARKK